MLTHADIGTGIPASALTGTGSGYNSRRNSISSKDIDKILSNGTGYATPGGTGSRRNSITRLPWPEPSPVRELPPPIPKQKVSRDFISYPHWQKMV